MFTRFFIDRPIFATVISVVITLAGFVSVWALPVAQYPEVTPPTVLVTAFYPGANAKTVRDTVAAPIEAQVSGVEGMVYMMSQSTNDGAYKLTVTFKASSDSRMDSDMAQVLVQNRVSLALPVIPAIVQNEGISVKKMSPNTLMIVNLVSPDGSKDNIFLSNYATINVKDELGRLPGVAGITYLGQRDYSLRAWLDPDKLAARGLSGMDVVTAISQQNVQVAAGQIGQPPTTRAQQFQLTINTQGRLTDPEQFANIIIKAGRSVAGQVPAAVATTPALGANATTATAPQATAILRLRDVVRANRYYMRIQLDPDKLGARHLEIAEVVDALKPNALKPTPLNIVADGPPVNGHTFTWLATYGGSQPPHIEDVAKTVIHAGSKPADTVRLGDVSARDGITHLQSLDEEGVQLGSQQYDQSCTLDGKPSVALSIYQLPGSNALDTAKGVYAKMRELKKRFPGGVDYKIVYDTTPFIQESVDEVWHTLRDAVILVAIVVLFFLQDWRAMILPMIDVPVSLVGTFAVMAAMGFTLNNLTLFGLVLAIGIVVDDAIVVLENIERLMATGLDARTATIKAMDEITGPILAITLVLSAVFIPCCFLAGLTGQFFRQFAVTIAVSTIISAINAITMTPSRAVLIFKTEQAEHGGHEMKREALPWWSFALFGGIATYWLLPNLLVAFFDMPDVIDVPTRGGPLTLELVPWHKPGDDGVAVSPWLSLASAVVYFLPGMLLGGIFGWFLIQPVNAFLGWIFRGFNRVFDSMTRFYGKTIAHILRVAVFVCFLYGGLLVLTGWQFTQAPTGFIPQQDKGYLILNVQLPDAASVDRTERVMAHIERLVRGNKREALKEDDHPAEENSTTRIARRYPGLPGIAHTVGVAGQSLILNANAPNLGSMYVLLNDFDKRHRADLSADAIANDIVTLCRDGGYIITKESLEEMQGAGATEAALQKLKPLVGRLYHLQKLKARLAQRLSELERTQIEPLVLSQAERVPPVYGATVTAFGGPPVDGLGTTGGFKLIIEDRGNIGQDKLQAVCDKIVKVGNETEGLAGLSHSSRASTPWLYLEIDRDKAQVLGVSVKEVFDTLQVYFGSYYVNNFNEFGRTWQVNVQADQKYRGKVTDIRQLQVRNNQGMMVRLGTFTDVRDDIGPVMVMRYNMYAATAITGNTAPGTSSGQAIDMMQDIADRELPHSMAYEWTELTYLQLEAGNKAMFVFLLAVMFVFLVLAAQYESWSLPLAVILVVPMCLLCSVTGIIIAKMEVNIFTQIGFVVLVGLASKNAILIVEFAKQRREEGVGAWEATVEAAQLRLRPILMTSFAFILGVVPLVIAQGAGAEMRRSLGLAVFAGMCGVTLFGIFLTPVFYYVIQRWTPSVPPKPHGDDLAAIAASPSH